MLCLNLRTRAPQLYLYDVIFQETNVLIEKKFRLPGSVLEGLIAQRYLQFMIEGPISRGNFVSEVSESHCLVRANFESLKPLRTVAGYHVPRLMCLSHSCQGGSELVSIVAVYFVRLRLLSLQLGHEGLFEA